MSFNDFVTLVTTLAAGGPPAVISLLVLIIAALYLDRRRMLAEIKAKDLHLDKIVDDYYRGNVTLAEALNSLKSVMFEIKSRF